MSHRSISDEVGGGGGVFGHTPNKKGPPLIIAYIDKGGQDTIIHNVIGTQRKQTVCATMLMEVSRVNPSSLLSH